MAELFPRLLHTVIDTTDVRGLAEFYRELLGLTYRPGDESPTEGEDWLVLRRRRRRQPARVPARRPAGADDVAGPRRADAAAPRLHRLRRPRSWSGNVPGPSRSGATVIIDRTDDPDEPLYVFADPSGHPFCIFV